MSDTAVFVIFWLIQAGVGYWIGHGKGRPWLGLALGFFLGVIGWVIMAFIRPTYDELVRRQQVRNRVTQAAADTRPGVLRSPRSLTYDEAVNMTSAEQQAYIKYGTVPARFEGEQNAR